MKDSEESEEQSESEEESKGSDDSEEEGQSKGSESDYNDDIGEKYDDGFYLVENYVDSFSENQISVGIFKDASNNIPFLTTKTLTSVDLQSDYTGYGLNSDNVVVFVKDNNIIEKLPLDRKLALRILPNHEYGIAVKTEDTIFATSRPKHFPTWILRNDGKVDEDGDPLLTVS